MEVRGLTPVDWLTGDIDARRGRSSRRTSLFFDCAVSYVRCDVQMKGLGDKNRVGDGERRW